jgi:hypothetical protein
MAGILLRLTTLVLGCPPSIGKHNAHHHPPAGLFADDINIEPGRVNDDVRQSSQNILQATFLRPDTISRSTGLDRSIGPCHDCSDWLSARRVLTSSPSRYLAAWISVYVCRDKESATSIPAELRSKCLQPINLFLSSSKPSGEQLYELHAVRASHLSPNSADI